MHPELAQASFVRRGLALVLETALFFITLCIGWYVWLLFTAPRGTTPAKQMLGLVIARAETGRVASAGRVWIREVGSKNIAPALASLIAFETLGDAAAGAIPVIYLLAGLLYPLIAQVQQTIWDFPTSTVVMRRLVERQRLTAGDYRRIEESLPSRRSFSR
jgi:hypothetical protein